MKGPMTMNRTEAEALIAGVLDDHWNSFGDEHGIDIEPSASDLFDVQAITERTFDVTPNGDHSLRAWVGKLQILMLARQHRRELQPTGLTDLPCPDWCDRSSGHTFDQFDNALVRNHVHRFTDHASCVTVELKERTTDPIDGLSDLRTDPAALNVAVHLSNGFGYLTADGARRLAKQLMHAADLHDQEHKLIVGEGHTEATNS